ncbi:hypothetical protein PL263_10755 [Methylomonas sp. EFPC3]|uniref:VPLPA-CTERM sorting domain-containing protein n=1 Tax=Methylomonas sp. EFPC3 TaxID=3021710 RepID=UPI002416A847|nr:hypothetical protein [Methylomonas sp. EFPC3]WFP48593.1 hypothetical protein PL263_10755 [Methylomonas sp. EFPC3]
MKQAKRGIFPCLLIGLLATVAAPASASYQVVNVAATAGPWMWEAGGLNDSYRYGLGADGSPASPDYTAPSRLKLADIGIGAGDAVFIGYRSGLTSAIGGVPAVDNSGYVGNSYKDDQPGSSGQVLPSFYLPGEWGVAQNPANPASYGVFLQALLGALTDDAGNIVELFSLGTVVDDNGNPTPVSGVAFTVPVGVSYIQFGFNDDIFHDNTGSVSVCVNGDDAQCTAPVPLPAAAWLFGVGIAGLLGYRPRRRFRG